MPLTKQALGWRHPCLLETTTRSQQHPTVIHQWLQKHGWLQSCCVVSDTAIWEDLLQPYSQPYAFQQPESHSKKQSKGRSGRHAKRNKRINCRQFRSLLGQEFDVLIYDGFSGFHPDALAALSNVLVADGVFIIYAPPLTGWHRFNDPERERLLAYPYTPAAPGYFLNYLQTAIDASTSWNRLVIENNQIVNRAVSPWLQQRLVAGFSQSLQADQIFPASLAVSTFPPSQSSQSYQPLQPNYTDQRICIEAILTLASTENAVLVVSAGRGRGKSAALGISAATWLQQAQRIEQKTNQMQIWVTAPNRDSVHILFQHARKFCEQQSELASGKHSKVSNALLFLAPDELLTRLNEQPEAQPAVLFIDEAGALPLSILSALLKQVKRCVLATTTHGYEGCGQGFRLRLLPMLDALVPNWQHVQLKQPIRWGQDDPLEAFINETFMLDSTEHGSTRKHKAAPPPTKIKPSELQINESTADDLLTQPKLLRKVFQLLTTAHYRTTPDDLRTLLDSPALRVFTVFDRHQLLGCLLLAEETPFTEPELKTQIWQGKRRPRGHLLQLCLAQQLNIKESLDLPFARVVRIAIHPSWQNQGIGTWLLSQVTDLLAPQIAVVGASFASELRVNCFWLRQGYQLVRLGMKKDAFTGSYSALVVKDTSTVGKSLTEAAKQRFYRRLDYDKLIHPEIYRDKMTALPEEFPAQSLQTDSNSYSDLNPATSSDNPNDLNELMLFDLNELMLFAQGQRPYPVVADALYRTSKLIPDFIGNQCWQLCIRDQIDIKTAVKITNSAGKKAVIDSIRQAATAFIQAWRIN